MGSSRTFTDSTNIIECTASAVLANLFDGGGSTAIWTFANSAGGGSFARIMQKAGDTSASGWQMTNSNVGTNFIFTYSFSGTNGQWTITNGFVFGTWQHWVVTYDADSVANLPTFYLNGVSQTVTVSTTPTGTRDDDSAELYEIGNRGNQVRAFDGELCHATAWDRILSSTEVLEVLHKAGNVPRGMIGYWPLFGTSSPEVDYSVNNNVGTVTLTTESFNGPPLNRAG